MKHRRYRLMLSATTDHTAIAVRQIVAANELAAACKAISMLSDRRVTDPQGCRWDQWHLGIKDLSARAWVVVASGDHLGVWTPMTLADEYRASRG